MHIKQVFSRIQIIDSKSKNLTTFRIKFDVYKYQVLSFELCNEWITYQYYMNDVFFNYLDDFVSAYINDILIYNNSKMKHTKHVKKILARLRKVKLWTNINKCEFSIHETKYLKLIVNRDEIKMNFFSKWKRYCNDQFQKTWNMYKNFSNSAIFINDSSEISQK